MEVKVLRNDRSIAKVNWFFLITIVWAIVAQFLPINVNLYQYIAFLIPISIYLIINRRDAERILRPNRLNLISLIIIFLIWIASLPIMLLFIELYVKFFGSTLVEIITEDFHELFFWNFFYTAITPAIIEEILMRGIILDGYRNKPRFIAAILNGFMFGMLHLNSFQFFHTFIMGVVASYIVFATNSIFAGITIHLINNGLPLVINYLYPPNPNVGYAAKPDFLALGTFAIVGAFSIYLLINLLFRVNNIPIKEDRVYSQEKIFTLPLILSIFIFIGFSVLLIISLKSITMA
ncbi:MAG: CPBP family intramembrane metalloprotease [Tissierellia bacterium]|nr:CPBP family intramembrane metalloprotease [Tissierellia bacterium]